MTWVKLDDRFFDNPKIAALSDGAKVAYLEALTYCARELTDGFVPLKKAKGIAGKPRVIQELAPGLWEPCKDGFNVHDYLDYNPSKEVAIKRKQDIKQIRSEAGKKGMANRWQIDNKSDNKNYNPVTPIPEGDLDQSPSYPIPETPPPRPPLPRRVVAVAFEQSFGRILSPTELELVKALDEEHPQERIEYALREAAALNKRSVRYVQRTCERMANDGDANGTDGGFQAARSGAGGVAVGISDLDRRRAALVERRRTGVS